MTGYTICQVPFCSAFAYGKMLAVDATPDSMSHSHFRRRLYTELTTVICWCLRSVEHTVVLEGHRRRLPLWLFGYLKAAFLRTLFSSGQCPRVSVPSRVLAVGRNVKIKKPVSRIHSVGKASQAPVWIIISQQFLQLRQQWRRLLPMCSLFFCMAFINTLVNNLSLSLVMTSMGGGAEVIPFLNVYAVLPASVVFTVCYAYASHHMTRDRLFNFVIFVFAGLVMLFAFVLYPSHATLHLHGLADSLTQVLPSGFLGGIGMIRNWTFSLFYCISELWGDVGLSLLFWGFANEITHVDSAPVLYPLFGIGANLAQILGGIVLRLYSSVEFAVAFRAMTMQMMGCMVIVIGLHQWIGFDAKRHQSEETQEGASRMSSNQSSHNNRRQLNGRTLNGVSNVRGATMNTSKGRVLHVSWRGVSTQKSVVKKSFRASLQTLSKSPQIRCLAMMTLAQGLSVSLMEFLWKFHLKIAYPTTEAFTGFLGDISTATGVITALLMCFSPVLFKKFSWSRVASITPDVLTWGGLAFFGACMAYHLSARLAMTGVAAMLVMPVLLSGSALFVLSRGAKFSLFKPAEEMVYISLDEESRTKGKAAVDVVGAQVGKSGGSFIQQVLLMMSGGRLLSITPIMIGAYFFMLHIWKEAVHEIAIHHQYRDSIDDPESSPDIPSSTTYNMIPAI